MRPALLVSSLVLLLLSGCRGESGESAPAGSDGGYGSSAWDTGAWAAPGDAETPPAEDEEDRRALPPAQTDVYVFVASPERDTVTRIHVQTLDVRTVAVGDEPRDVITTPDYATAVVRNHAGDSVSLVDAEALTVTEVPIREDLNRMELSPDGAWAVLWHDPAAVLPDDPPPHGSQSFSEASFVNVVDGTHHPMAVGFLPKDVVFTPDGATALVVSDAALAVVDLTAEAPLPELVTLSEELEPPLAEEVEVVDSGAVAWVRQRAVDALLVVDVATGTTSSIPVASGPTDLDLSPDGAELVVVSRDAKQLQVFDADDPTVPPHRVPLPADVSYGALQFLPDGQSAVLYTTADLLARYGVWDRTTDTITERALVKPIDTVALSPTGEHMLVFHTLENALDGDADSLFFDAHALTLVELSSHLANPMLLPAEVSHYVQSDDGSHAYFVMEGEPFLEVLDYGTMLPEEVALKSQPVFTGVLPDLDTADGLQPLAWVSQEHELGRITFYDVDAGDAETLTGFELNAAVE